jgi:hypothetical protein
MIYVSHNGWVGWVLRFVNKTSEDSTRKSRSFVGINIDACISDGQM